MSCPLPTSALAAALPFVLAAASAAQSDVVLIDPLIGPAIASVAEGGLSTTPNGDAIVSYCAEIGTRQVLVRRVSAAGDRVWTTEIPIEAGPFPTIQQALTPDGDLFLAASRYPDFQLLFAIDGDDGSIRWQQDLVFPSFGPGFPRIESIAATDNGDLLVASWYPTLFQVFEDVRFGRFDGATGALEWEHADLTFWQTPTFKMRASEHGIDLSDAGLFGSSPGKRALRVDPDGSVAYSTVLQLSGNPAAIYTDDAGNAYVVDPNGVAISLDPTGNVRWTRTYEVLGDPVGVRDIGPGGELVGLIRPGGFDIATFDPAGQLLGTRYITDGALDVYDVEFASDGGVLVVYSDTASDELRATHVRADGSTVWDSDLGLDPAFTLRGIGAEGRNGHLWVSATRGAAFGIDPAGFTLKIVPGGDAGVPSCIAPVANSSGDTGRIRAVGSGTAALNNLTLLADQLPPSQFVLFLNARAAGVTPNPGGSDGLLCLGGSIARYVRPGEIRRASPAGLASLELDLTSTPEGIGTTAILAGETLFFQAWHRDVTPAGSNLTNATQVDFD